MDLFNQDCLGENGLCKLEAQSVDMILCDLPYGITSNPWDISLNLDNIFKEYDRIIKDKGVIVLFGNQPFTTDLINAYRKYFRYSLVWDKNKGTDFFNCRRKPMKSHKDILVFYKKKPQYSPQMVEESTCKHKARGNIVNHLGKRMKQTAESIACHVSTRYPLTILEFKVETGKHTKQKPVPLCEFLIKSYTKEGDLVLDNTMGSGTTGVACKNTNRRFIGYELDKIYFEVAQTR